MNKKRISWRFGSRCLKRTIRCPSCAKHFRGTVVMKGSCRGETSPGCHICCCAILVLLYPPYIVAGQAKVLLTYRNYGGGGGYGPGAGAMGGPAA
jgi:hypothetical protein